jgi:RNA polymerase sigma factor (TIGR02999 family)
MESHVTQILRRVEDGDAAAGAQLMPLVYAELRRLAARRLAREAPGQTLQATARVHEAYLRLIGSHGERTDDCWQGRGHFFAAAAEAMRRIVIDRARRRKRLKRGGGLDRVDLELADLATDAVPDEVLALDEALTALAEKHPDKARLVNLRYFAGLTIEEAARAMGISTSTADRHWAYARAWLYRHMSAGEGPADRTGNRMG